MSWSQSAPGQPDAAPLSTPMHQGVFPAAASTPVTAVNWSNVVGAALLLSAMPAPATTLGSYQIWLFKEALMKIPYSFPLTEPSLIQELSYWSFIWVMSTALSR